VSFIEYLCCVMLNECRLLSNTYSGGCINKDLSVILPDCCLAVSSHPEGPATGRFYRPSLVLKPPVAAVPRTGAHMCLFMAL
jgi:hypothetical protein